MQRIAFVSTSTPTCPSVCRAKLLFLSGMLTLFATGCSHTASVRMPVDSPIASRDLPTNYAEWLAGTGFSPAITVKYYDRNQHRLHLSVTNQYPVLVAVAKERELDLPRRFYLKLRQMLPRTTRDARLTLKGVTPCLSTEVWEQDQEILVKEESCLSGDTFELAPKLVAAVTNIPAGKLTVNGSAPLFDRIIEILRAQLQGKGEFSLISKKSASASFELRGMRNQVLVGNNWWETVGVDLELSNQSIQNGNPQAPVEMKWEASGRYGGGLINPPQHDGYNADLEPTHSKALAKYVSKLMAVVQEELNRSKQ